MSNSNNLEEEFSPEKWTQKELVKHLYREVSTIHSKIDVLTSTIDDKYSKLDQEYRIKFDRIDNRIDELETFRGAVNMAFKIIGGITTLIIGAGISKFFGFF